jgi:acyl carrier protein
MKITRDDFLVILRDNVQGFEAAVLDGSKRLNEIGVDSLGFATLLFALEDKLGVHIDERELDGLNGESTLEQLSMVFRRLGHEIEV